MNKKSMLLKLRGKTAVYIDWANVHGWEKSLKCDVDIGKLFRYLEGYSKIKEMRFYFGTDEHPASRELLRKAKRIGYKIVTKPVKYLPIRENDGLVWKRKCDFDLEIGLDCLECLDRYSSFIFFSGDGDFQTLYKRLIARKKQVIVVYMYGHLGKEVWKLKRGIYKISIKKLQADLFVSQKMTPRRRRGA